MGLTLLQRIGAAFRGEKAEDGGRSYSMLLWPGFTGKMGNKANVSAEAISHIHSWVFACFDVLASSTANAVPNLYSGDKPVESHPLLTALLEPEGEFTYNELMYLSSMYLDSVGETMWYVVRSGNEITGFIPLRGDWFTIKPGPDGAPIYFYDDQSGKKMVFERREIIHIRRPNPANPTRGLSLISAGAYAVDELTKMHKTRNALLDNDSTPPFGLTFQDAMTPDQFEKLKHDFERRHKGPGKAGRTAFLPGNAKVVEFPVKFEELLYLNAMNATREEVCGICRVPLAKLGLVQDVNRANSEAMDATFMSETIQPRVGFFEDALNSRLMTLPGMDRNLRWVFELDIPADRTYELDKATRLVQAGVLTINEVRAKYGYDAVQGGDVSLVPFSLTPLSYAVEPAPETPVTPPETPQAADKRPGVNKQLQGEARRKAAWKSFDARIRPWEKVMRRMADDYFDEMSAKVRANLRKSFKEMKAPPPDVEALVPDEILEGIALAARMSPEIELMLREFAEETAAAYGAEYVFNPNMPRMAAWLGEKLKERMIGIAGETANEIRSALTEGVRAGEGIDKIAQRVADAMGQAKSYRSVRIAQTEVIGASNRGTMEGLRVAGFERKEWLSSRDGRVRDTHAEADSQIRGLDEPFDVGGYMLDHPGDMLAGAPGETINCRCTVVPVIGGENE